jgi:uncharacterized damage-inducible protein DinB
VGAYDTLLGEAIESWEFARGGVSAEAAGIPEDRWSFRPHPGARSVAGIVRHIISSGLMMVGELTNPDGDFTRSVPGGFEALYSRHLPDDPAPEELKTLLESTLAEGVAKFRDAGEVQMLRAIRRFDGALWTRLAWLHHGIAHEEYHRGQLAMYARIQGIVPALTRAIHGAAAE